MCDVAKDDTDLAIRRYDIIMRYLASDNAIYWTRSQLLLVAHTTLLGFWGNQLPRNLGEEPPLKLIFLLIECGLGGCLCLIWHYAIRGGQYWMDRWEKTLLELEDAAFGKSAEVYRGMDGASRPKPRTRDLARWTLVIFCAIWSFASLMTLYILVCRYHGWC